MFSPNGLPIAWVLAAFLGVVGVLLVGSGLWFIRGSFGPVSRRKKAARYALVIGVCLLAAIFMGSAFLQPVFATISSSQTSILSQFYCSATATSSYIIQTDGTYYYAFNPSTCALVYGGSGNAGGVTGTSFSSVMNNAITSLPAGGAITIGSGTYEETTQLYLNRSVSLLGEAAAVVSPAMPPADPDYTAIPTGGVIINVVTAGLSGIIIGANVDGVTISNLIINFTTPTTGTGINADPGYNNNGLLYSKLDNIFVLLNDGNHYGFRFVNFQHDEFGRLWSEGGLGFYFADNSNGVDYGNSVFQELFARVKYDRNIANYVIDFTSKGYAGHVLAFLMIQRLQIMDTSATSTEAALHFNQTKFITMLDTDIEYPTSHQLIRASAATYTLLFVTNLSGGNITMTRGGHNGFTGSGFLDANGYTISAGSDTGDWIDPNLQVAGTIVGLGGYTASTSQKYETRADKNLLTYAPQKVSGSYSVCIAISVSAANNATLGWTATWTDSDGHAQTPTNLAVTKEGTAAPAMTFSASANDAYSGCTTVDVDSSGTNIVIETTFSGTSIAYKASAWIVPIIA